MSDILEKAAAALNEKLSGGVFDASAKFDIADVGSIVLDAEGARVADDDTDVTLSADAETFQAIFDGDMNPTNAFMTGKLTVDGDMGTAMKLASVLAGLYLPLVVIGTWILSDGESFQRQYPHYHQAAFDWTLFLIYELLFLFYWIGWEYLWRGFMIFGTSHTFGFQAVFIQAVPFAALQSHKVNSCKMESPNGVG